MAKIEEKIYTVLTADAELNAMVGKRIYPTVSPQNVEMPCIVYYVTSIEKLNTLSGASNLEHPTVQFNIFSETYKEGIAISARTHTVMLAAGTYKCTLNSDSDEFFDEEVEVYQRVMEFSCWHRE